MISGLFVKDVVVITIAEFSGKISGLIIVACSGLVFALEIWSAIFHLRVQFHAEVVFSSNPAKAFMFTYSSYLNWTGNSWGSRSKPYPFDSQINHELGKFNGILKRHGGHY